MLLRRLSTNALGGPGAGWFWARCRVYRIGAPRPGDEPEICSPQLAGHGDNGRVKWLNGMDAMLLYSETPNLHTHTLKVAIVDVAEHDGEFNFDVFRHTLLNHLYS